MSFACSLTGAVHPRCIDRGDSRRRETGMCRGRLQRFALALCERRDQSAREPSGSGRGRRSGHMRYWLAAGVATVAALFVASAQGATRAGDGSFGGSAAVAATPTISAPADMIVGEGDGTIDLI